MSTPIAMTRTNYFRVNDPEAFEAFVNDLVTDSSEKVRLMKNPLGEVGFCIDAVIYGSPVDMFTNEMLEKLGEKLFADSPDAIEEFMGTDIRGMDSTELDNLFYEVVAQMPDEQVKQYMDKYIDSSLNYDGMWDKMVEDLQGLLEPGCACIMISIEYESLCSINGTTLVITQNGIEQINLIDDGMDRAIMLLGDPNYNPQMTN